MSEKNKEWENKNLEEKSKKSWLSKEGELTVDVYQTEENIVIQTTIAGVSKDDLEIITEKDMVTIKGERERIEEEEIKEFFIEECFWGPFSREIVLPEETDPSRIKATMSKGVLTIKVPRIEREKRREIELEEE
ncbi:MAG: Hsp20/alpha crystallin family protein [Patescibacteria group bacterium]